LFEIAFWPFSPENMYYIGISIFLYCKLIAGQWTGQLSISLKSSHIEKNETMHMVGI
jgi:hypothetical protein